MDYFTLTCSTDENIIGCYHQTEGVPNGYNVQWFDQPNSMTKLDNDTFPEFNPDLYWELKEEAIPTDLISATNITSQGLLISETFINLINPLLTMNHRIYSAKVLHKNTLLNYHWVHFKQKDLKGVDLNKSVFFKSEFGFDKEGTIKLESYEDALKIMQQEDCFIIPEKIIIKENYQNIFNEIFYLPIPNEIILTKKATNIIKANNISGCEIKII